MILASKKTLGKFTKVLGFEKPPPPLWEKYPKNPGFFLASVLYLFLYPGLCGHHNVTKSVIGRPHVPGKGGKGKLIES